MKRIVTAIGCLFFAITFANAQKKSILLEPQTRKINQGEPLPSQSSFDIQVPVGTGIGVIMINIFKGGRPSDIIEKTHWTRPVYFKGDFAELPVDLRLRNNSKYGFDVSLYSLLSDSEMNNLRGYVEQNISNYLNALIESNMKALDIDKKSGEIVQDLNAIVKRSLTYYKNTQQRDFEGFSDIVKLKVKQLADAKMSNAIYNVTRTPADSLMSQDDIKVAYGTKLQSDLLQIILSEADNYLNLDFVKLSDHFVISNRVSESSQTVLPLFVGYGGVYLGGSFNDLEYDSQPYAGLSFPLGRGNENHYGRTSFILGIFLANFKDGAGNTITGPIVDRPVFAGLGFRIYDFINLNAGMVAISSEKQNLSNIKTSDVQLKPFIGLNAQFNLWLGLHKK
ncbi:MAG: hypothetical protein ABIN89_03395 [Chitinophagaceae bacterium]